MTSTAVEDYLKRLYLEQNAHAADARSVSTGRLATLMEVTPGSATSMLKALAAAGLVDHELRRGARLTPAGEQLALHVLRRHRLLELFLVEVLGLDWSVVHEEAERLEHAVSDQVLDRIDAVLGHPSVDPHGDPIPRGDLSNHIETSRDASLMECPAEQPLRVTRVLDQDPEFLRFVQAEGIGPGSALTLQSRSRAGDAVVLLIDGRPLTIGSATAGKILVEPLPSSSG